MKLIDWVEREGHGAITRLADRTKLAYTTVFDAVYGRRATQYETAKRLSDATDGDVSIDEICDRSD